MLTAIILVAIATIAATAIAWQSQLSARRGIAVFTVAQSLALAQGAEAMAAYALRDNRQKNPGVVSPGQAWAKPYGPVELDAGAVLEASLEDQAGKFNLNSVVMPATGGPSGAPVLPAALGAVPLVENPDAVGQFVALLEALKIDTQFAARLVDWIDSDSQPTFPGGAEDSFYLGEQPPHRTLNMPLTSVSELLALGMDRPSYDRLAPFVTALPVGTKLNICTAPGEVLDAFAGQRSYALDPQTLRTQRTAIQVLSRQGGVPEQRRQHAPQLCRPACRHGLAVFPAAHLDHYWHHALHLVQSPQSGRGRADTPDPPNLRHGISMADWLILRMPRAADAAAGWLVVDAEGRPLAQVENGPLEQAGAAAAGRRVAVLVPAAEVLCLEVELPVRSGARAAALVPFALEEQLATDVETQHFAVAPAAGGRTAVAVVARALIEEWLARLAAAGHQARIAVHRCGVDAAGGRAHGGAARRRHAELQRRRAGRTAHAGRAARRLRRRAGDRARRRDRHDALCCCMPTRRTGSGAPPRSRRRGPRSPASRCSCSLPARCRGSRRSCRMRGRRTCCRAPTRRARRFGAGWSRWRTAAALAAALLLLHVGAQLFSLWRLGRSERELDAQIATIAGPLLAARE